MVQFNEYAEQWEEQVLALKRPKSIRVMASHIRAHLKPAFGEYQLTELNNQTVQAVFSKKAKDMSPKSVKNLWATFATILAAAQRDGLLEKLPQPVLPKVYRKAQPWLTLAQMRSIIRTGPDSLLYWLLAETGVRIEEAMGLTTNALDPDHGGALRITENLKTDSSFRTICISQKLFKMLSDCDGQIFRQSADTYRHRLIETLAVIGLPRMGFHAFRRGNATILANDLNCPEKVAAYRLGHRAAGLTFGLYAQMVPYSDRKYADKLGKLLEYGK